jgi:phage terminase large subunit-like protein
VIYDELGSADNRALFDAMDSAMGGRENPLMLVISTQAADDFAPMSQLIDYGLQLKGGDIRDPAFHLTLYSAPEDADPWSRKSWRAANPALVISARCLTSSDLRNKRSGCRHARTPSAISS